jgi:co-chaperonin GroES (HSP10)
MRIRAVQENILIKLPEGEQTTPGGIVLPVRERGYQFVKVVSMDYGSGYDDNSQPPCKIGDTILVNSYSQGETITIDGARHAFIGWSDVVAVKEDDKA